MGVKINFMEQLEQFPLYFDEQQLYTADCIHKKKKRFKKVIWHFKLYNNFE